MADSQKHPSKSKELMHWEGGVYAFMTGIAQRFLSPFALLFGAGGLTVALIATLPSLAGSGLQLLSPRMLAWLRRPRRHLTAFAALQAITWALLPLLFLLPKRAALTLLVLLAIVNGSCPLLLNPVWTAYMGELLHERERARYFARRNRLSSILTLTATLLAGGILALVPSPGKGFALLFVIAAAARGLSAWMTSRIDDLDIPKPRKRYSLGGFLKRIPSSDFGKFARFHAFFSLMVWMASPFFVLYFLEALGLSYFRYALIEVAMMSGTILSLKAWALAEERKGMRRILLVTGLGIGLVPLLWAVSASYGWLLLVSGLSGVFWAGFSLTATNYALAATRPESRTYAISYFNLLNNSAVFVGGLLGSGLLLVTRSLGITGTNAFLLLFATSGLLRLVVWGHYAGLIKELRFVEVPLLGRIRTVLTILPREPVVLRPPITQQDLKERLQRRPWDFDPPKLPDDPAGRIKTRRR